MHGYALRYGQPEYLERDFQGDEGVPCGLVEGPNHVSPISWKGQC